MAAAPCEAQMDSGFVTGGSQKPLRVLRQAYERATAAAAQVLYTSLYP